MRYIIITNRNKINYLEANGIYPEYEEYETAWYCRSPQLRSLLEDYQIQATFYESQRKR